MPEGYSTNAPPTQQVISIEHGENWSGHRTADGVLHVDAVVTNKHADGKPNQQVEGIRH